MKKLILLVVVALMLASTGCATVGKTGPEAAAAQGIPWYQDIQNWTPYQKANFFMQTWESQLSDYNTQNAIPNKSPELIKVLKTKQQVLEQSRLPVRAYVAAVNSGTPVQDEQDIVKWLRQLQTLMLQYVK